MLTYVMCICQHIKLKPTFNLVLLFVADILLKSQFVKTLWLVSFPLPFFLCVFFGGVVYLFFLKSVGKVATKQSLTATMIMTTTVFREHLMDGDWCDLRWIVCAYMCFCVWVKTDYPWGKMVRVSQAHTHKVTQASADLLTDGDTQCPVPLPDQKCSPGALLESHSPTRVQLPHVWPTIPVPLLCSYFLSSLSFPHH